MVKVIQKLTGMDEETSKKAGFAFCYFFCILAGYFVIQPLRDEFGLLIGEEFIPGLFRWSMLIMLLASPLFSFLLNKLNRLTFVKSIYRFFALNLLVFFGFFKYLESTGQMVPAGDAEQVAGVAFGTCVAFFLWVGVFNLFATSIFWALLADIFDGKKSKKLFGFVGAGGTAGQWFGSFLTTNLVDYLGPTNLFLITVVFMELAVQAMLRLTKDYQEPAASPDKETSKPNALTGVTDIVKSPYLIGICLYIFLYSFTSSFLYFQKQSIVADALSDRAARAAFFAKINLAVSTLTLIVQVFLTGRLLTWVGLAAGLALVPAVTTAGFIVLASFPSLLPLAVVEVLRKISQYSISKPSREILYTVVSQREKYLSKSFIDTVVYRGGDFVASAAADGIKLLTKSLPALSMAAVPVAILYLVVGLGLGRAHGRRMKEQSKPEGIS